MRVSSLAVFGLFSSVLATPIAAPAELVERQLPISNTKVVDNAFKVIKAGTVKLDNAIKKINSTDLTLLLPLDGLAQDLDNTIKDQTTKVAASPPIAVFSALGVQAEAQDLINTVKQTLSDLKTKKKYTDASFTTDIVLNDLQLLKDDSDKFVDALKPKVPSAAGFLADYDKKQLDDAFNDAITYFKKPASS